MDIFKLLTRATKPTNKSSAITQPLPSSGRSSNPQLYNDAIQPRGQKRKADDTIESATSTLDNENSFTSKADSKKAKKRAKKALRKETSTTQPTIPPPPQLSQEECRSILKSHRIKHVILPPQHQETEAERKKRLKRRALGKPEKKKPKAETKQIFPQPLQSFAELQTRYGISKRLAENIEKEGYKIPTEVQMGALPLLIKAGKAMTHTGVPEAHDTVAEEHNISDMNGVDLLSVAPTGSGKTLAFLLPAINMMVQRRRMVDDDSHELQAIVVAPTRELVAQIVNEGRKLANGTGIKVVEMTKGMRIVEEAVALESAEDENKDAEGAMNEEEAESSEASDEGSDSASEEDSIPKKTSKKTPKSKQPLAKADILVTTPLALLNAISKTPLPTIEHLILDEADVLLDPLFRDQTLGIWKACINPKLNVSLWSATMGSSIESLALTTLTSHRVSAWQSVARPVIRLVIGLKDSAIPNISHKLIYAGDTEKGKLLALRQLLRPSGSATDGPALRPPFLVFVQTIPRAIALHAELLYDIPAEAGGSTRLAVLHSDLSPTARSTIMSRFRAGEIWILITTDILSRGVDFRGINGVVNFDIPNSAATYVHRVGRTGRAGRDGGVAVTLYTKEDVKYVRDVASVIAESEKAAGKEEGGVQKWLLDALPKVSKKDRAEMKVRGVATRRAPAGEEKGTKKGKGKGDAARRISSKSGYERKVENRKRGAIEGSKRRKDMDEREEADGDEWGGITE